MMSVHVNNNCAKRMNLVANFLLTVREVLAAKGVDMVSGDLNGTANTKLSTLPKSGVKGQAIHDLDRFELGLSHPRTAVHVTLSTSTCATLWPPYGCEEHAEEANGDLEAEQLLRLSSVTKCRSRIMGLCFGGAATGAPCENVQTVLLGERAEMHGFFAFALRTL